MTEDQLEQETLAWLAEVGWRRRYGPELAPDGSTPERADYRQVLPVGCLRRAIAVLNPDVPHGAREDALKQVLDLGTPSLLAANRQFHRLLVKNLTVDWSARESVQAKLRLMVKRILRKYKYPPDQQNAAVELVLQQARVLDEAWA